MNLVFKCSHLKSWTILPIKILFFPTVEIQAYVRNSSAAIKNKKKQQIKAFSENT